MMIEPFRASDLRKIDMSHTMISHDDIDPTSLPEKIALSGDAYTVRFDDEIVFMGGSIEVDDRTCFLWSFVSPASGKHMVSITKAVKRFMDSSPYEIFYATVEDGFVLGHRWVKLLGFEWMAGHEDIPYSPVPLNVYRRSI